MESLAAPEDASNGEDRLEGGQKTRGPAVDSMPITEGLTDEAEEIRTARPSAAGLDGADGAVDGRGPDGQEGGRG